MIVYEFHGIPTNSHRGGRIVSGRLVEGDIAGKAETENRWLEIVERQVGALKFGSVLITVHEGRVVQVETSVKVRFDRPQ